MMDGQIGRSVERMDAHVAGKNSAAFVRYKNDLHYKDVQEQLHGVGLASRGKSAGDIRCLCNFSL